MSKINYIARVLTGVRFKKLNKMLETVKEKSGHSKIRTFCDIMWCAVRYGAGYYDYVMFGFYDMNSSQRDTYLTRVRNKKVCDIMNDDTYSDEFDDKIRFNKRFEKYLHRKTLDASEASIQQITDFLDGQEYIFAKMNHGSCGNGIEKLKVSDFSTPDDLLNYVKKKNIVVLEHVITQHPDMAKLNNSSVNTLRIVTDRIGDNVHIAYITVKIGRAGSFCDNSGQGGVLCRVDPQSGKICSVATDDYFNIFEAHPDTKIKFKGYQLPMVKDAITLAKEAAKVVPQIHHVGWDIAITPDGPVIIEGNDYPGTDLCQLAPHHPEKTGLWPYYKKLLKL